MVRKLTLLLSILFVKTKNTLELTWNTEKFSYQCCQSKNQLLMWNFIEGENERIMELQWFFNETTLICLDSKTIGFHVDTFYNGKIERNGKAGILVKDISVYDAGKYTLYVKLAEEKIRNVQHIFLTVEEQVPHQCKPRIEIHNQDVMYCSTTCSERSELSSEWIINGTRDAMGIGTQLRINAGINEQALCCLRGFKCRDDDQFCLPSPISSKIFTQRGYNEISTVKATNDDGNNTSNVLIIMGVIMMTASLFLIVPTVAYLMWRRHKSLDVKTKISNTDMECKEDHEQGHTEAGTTDRSSDHSNSNQNIQIVNNISMDGNLLQYMVESQKLLMIHMEEVREETIELKRLLPSYQYQKKLNTKPFDKAIEMTEVKCYHANHSDTDTSEYEDAVQGLRVLEY